MNDRAVNSLESQWAKLGILFNCEPTAQTPDLERLILATARQIGGNARLFPLVVTWLVEYSGFVARHRLKRLISAELEPDHRAALGLILESAIANGGGRELCIPVEACSPCPAARPLFDVHRGNAALERIAANGASALSRKWRVWAPAVALKRDAIRPVGWLLDQNSTFRDRIIRKGDLRSSILEVLRWDSDGHVRSESELARLSGATRTAVRKSLAALMQEGAVASGIRPGNLRDHGITLRSAA